MGDIFKALADPTRRAILDELTDRDGQTLFELCARLAVRHQLGASLARLETRIAFEELLARFPDYAVDEENAQRAYSGNVRGLATLPFEAKTSAAV